MARLKGAFTGQGMPSWVTAPLATDYLSVEQIRADELWPLKALFAYHDRLRGWCAENGADCVTESAGYPRLPRDMNWAGMADLEQSLEFLPEDRRQAHD